MAEIHARGTRFGRCDREGCRGVSRRGCSLLDKTVDTKSTAYFDRAMKGIHGHADQAFSRTQLGEPGGVRRVSQYQCFDHMNGTLYVGVTSDLVKRVWQHKNKQIDGFTKKYKVDRLVYFEIHENAESAIQREKQIKKWNRRWKLRIIEKMNSAWQDLYEDIV